MVGFAVAFRPKFAMPRAFIFIALTLSLLGVFDSRAQLEEPEDSSPTGKIDSIREDALRLRDRLESLTIEGYDNARALRQIDRLIDALDAPEEVDDPTPAVPAFQAVDRDIAYFRWDRLDQPSLEALLAGLATRENWAGVVVDFRFCSEGDWETVAPLASLFLGEETELIQRDSETISAPSGTGRWRRSPRVALVNRETSGPAEAMAAILRKWDLAVIVGESTSDAGDESEWRFADGSDFDRPLRPDIALSMDLESQRMARSVEAAQSLSRQLQGSRAFQDAVLENLSRFGSLPELAPPSADADEDRPVVDLHLERAVDLIRATGLALREPAQRIRR